MIAQFRFAQPPPIEAISIVMSWQENRAVGVVYLPDAVRELAEMSDYIVVGTDHTMQLPLALGYGVTIAALTGQPLYISGDASAWHADWGALGQNH